MAGDKKKKSKKDEEDLTHVSSASPVILNSKGFEINQIGFNDMTKMDDMTLDGVLNNLKDRYHVDNIYTFTATILVAINPYKNLPMYDMRYVKRYKGVRLGINAPHVFAVAEQAYNDMVQRKKNQSVLVSGESGAGKTMSTKFILRYLSDRTARASKIDEMVIASVPVLEALGNAKTLRNDNSSRFGKFIEVQFDTDYCITGSKTIPYLLEKSRITNHQMGERDFHIFYQLTEGMSKERQKKFKLGPATMFKYLVKQKGEEKHIAIKGLSEEKEFADFEHALDMFEVQGEVRDDIYRVVAAVLWLGNVEYKVLPGDKSAIKEGEPEQALKNACELLSVDYEKFLWGLTNKKIKAMREIINKPLSASDAKDMTDAVAKHIYSVLFEWLVSVLNSCTAADDYTSFIGVLDIFGFEVFELNSFEQFLINYTNERLQQFFNHYIFKLEQAEYEKEQIDWTVIEFKDNQDTLDLIENKRPPGIISLLDEESKFPRATDDSLIEKLHNNLEKNPLYGKPRLAKRKFSVKHYAGEVTYEVSGWRDRNRDELPPLLVEALQASTNQFMAILFADDDEDKLIPILRQREKTGTAFDDEGSPKPAKRMSFARGGAMRVSKAGQNKSSSKTGAEQGSAASKVTLATQFKQQLLDLMTMLGSTDPFFIRCIKPNEHKAHNDFDQELIYNQLLYAGMLETIRIRRMGYPIRYIHRDFFKRFCVICPEVAPSSDFKHCSTQLAKALGLDIPMECQIGLTKVVLKQHTANDLEDRRAIALTSTILKMQNWWRFIFARKDFKEKRENAILCQAWWRFAFARKGFLLRRRGASKIGAWYRMCLAIKQRKKLEEKKRKEEEERRRKEEEKRKKRIEKFGLEQVMAEEEAARKGEIEKLRQLAESAQPKEKKKKKKKPKLARVSSIKMEKMEEIEVPINVDSRIVLGLGWKGNQVGLDASVLMFRYQQHRDDVYYYKPRSNDSSIIHRGGYTGMVRRGQVEGEKEVDAEQIEINLSKVTTKTNTILVVVTVFDGDFSKTTDAYIRLMDYTSGHEYARFTLADAGNETARIMCKLMRQGHTRWRLKALGEPSQGRVFKHMISRVKPFLDIEPPKKKLYITIQEGQFKLRQSESKRRPQKSYKQLALQAEVYFDVNKEKTKPIKCSPDKTMKPNWQQQKSLSGHANYVEVAVLNSRGRLAGSQFLGRIVIDLDERGNEGEDWFDIERPDEGVRGMTYVEGKIKLSYEVEVTHY